MAKDGIRTETAEAFVRKVLEKSFNQKIDQEALRSAAEKVSRVIDEASPKKAA